MAGVNGTTLQLARELFKMMAGVDMCRIKAGAAIIDKNRPRSSQF
jgi:hypothetical protein